jgi:hypothetical protein
MVKAIFNRATKRTVFCSLLLSTLLAGTTVLTASSFNNQAFAADDTWYVGEGVQKGMWVKYNIQQLDTNEGRPFEMTIWFQDQDQSGTWSAPAWVVDQGSVINGTLRLAKNMASLSGGQVPDGMKSYISGYQGSLQWLDAYATISNPKPLSPSHWGVIAQIGGAPIDVVSQEKVSFAAAKDVCGADSCDSSLVLWHKGVDNKVWIVNEFPFPVKADTFASIASGQAPVQFKFELLATGTGQPPIPQGGSFVPKPPLTEPTGRGTYVTNIDWTPQSIQPGSEVTFGVTFTDNNGNALQRVNYDFTVTDASGKVIQDFKNQNTDPNTGAGTQKVKFDKAGSVQVSVTINTAEGGVAGGAAGFLERSDFNIVVVPEFPAGVVFIGTAALIGAVFVLTRFMRGGLTKLRDT